jgi:hypothetical protein
MVKYLTVFKVLEVPFNPFFSFLKLICNLSIMFIRYLLLCWRYFVVVIIQKSTKMKKIIFICLTVISMNAFISCDDTKDNIDTELTIQEKVELLEQGQWLLKGFENRVMYEFNAGKRYTFYGQDFVFTEPIPGTLDYSISNEFLFMDFTFDSIRALEFSCDNNIVEFFVDGKLRSTLFKLGSNYKDCLN